MPENEDIFAKRDQKAVLMKIMIDGIDPRDHGLNTDCFTFKLTQEAYKSIIALATKGQAFDYLSVTNDCQRRGVLDSMGGQFSVVNMGGDLSWYDGYQFAKHCKVLKLEAAKKKIKAQTQAMGGIEDISALALAAQSIKDAADQALSDGKVKEIKAEELMREMLAEEEEGEVKKISTGFDKLDKMTEGGFGDGEYVILGANTSVGKSAFASNIVENICEEKAVLFFTFEMSPKTVLRRIFQKDKGKMGGFYQAAENLRFVDTGKVMAEFSSNLLTCCNDKKYDLIIVDHIHLLRGEGRSIYEDRSMMSNLIQGLARRTNVPILALAQLSRANRHAGRPPMLHDLRDAGSLEEDADKVLLLHRDEKRARLEVAKNRTGETGYIDMNYDPDTTKFSERGDGYPPFDWGNRKKYKKGEE